MKTKVASIAYDELGPDTSKLDRDPNLRKLVDKIVGKDILYLSDDPLGCCSINVFRPYYHHSFHFDESEFSTTLMLQEASPSTSVVFQHTAPLRQSSDDMVLDSVAASLTAYNTRTTENKVIFAERRQIVTRASSILWIFDPAPSASFLEVGVFIV